MDPNCKPPALGPRRWLRLAWRVVRLPLIAYFVVLLVMMFFEESFVFVPSKFPNGDWQPRGLAFETASDLLPRDVRPALHPSALPLKSGFPDTQQ